MQEYSRRPTLLDHAMGRQRDSAHHCQRQGNRGVNKTMGIPIKVYRYEIQGTAADDQTWQTSGTITDEHNDVLAVFDTAMRLSFQQLTSGKAVFGKPGVGCSGPYAIRRIVIERS